MILPNCWICGELADSAEHMTKASDFRSVFGKVTQQAPVYRHNKNQPNELVRGVKADILKFAPSLCKNCNNTLTQPDDRAWERFSEKVRAMHFWLVADTRMPLERIFPKDAKESMLRIHLYFIKLLGCHAVESNIPLPINHFALCIKHSIPHPNIRLVFVNIPSNTTRYKIQVGDIQTRNKNAKTVSAVWFYIVDTLGVIVSYNEPNNSRLTLHLGWHPEDTNTTIMIR